MNSLLQAFGSQEQIVPSRARTIDPTVSGLGDAASQLNIFRAKPLAFSFRTFAMPFVVPGKLEALKRKRFTTEGRAGRIEKSLAALNQPEMLQLTADEWRFFAEDPDLDDQH